MPTKRDSIVPFILIVLIQLSYQATYQCDTSRCSLPNCKCPSTEIPGGHSPSDTPQFVTLTFDDAVSDLIWEELRQVLLSDRTTQDSAQCTPKCVLFVTNENTNYYNIQEAREKAKCEVAVHSITHTTNSDIEDTSRWYAEMVFSKKYTSFLSLTPEEEVVGWRFPFLMHNNAAFQVLAENGFLYDSSLADSHGTSYSTAGNMLWPYTMDFGSPQPCNTGPCPIGEFPGLWEVPMTALHTRDGQIYSVMDPPGNPVFLLDLFKHNFDQHYYGNRSPFGIHLHGAWFMIDNDRVGMLKEFLKYVASLDGVFFATNKEIIDWVKDPVDISTLRNRLACDSQSEGDGYLCDLTRCNYGHQYTHYWYQTCATCYLHEPSLDGDFTLFDPSIHTTSSSGTSQEVTTSSISGVTTSSSTTGAHESTTGAEEDSSTTSSYGTTEETNASTGFYSSTTNNYQPDDIEDQEDDIYSAGSVISTTLLLIVISAAALINS